MKAVGLYQYFPIESGESLRVFRIFSVYGGLLLFLAGCGTVDRIPVSGQLYQYRIQTTVDHRDAKYYLENYLGNNPANSSMDEEIQSIHREIKDRIPTREELRSISEEHSVDFAALVFGDQLLKQKDNQIIQQNYLSNLQKVKNGTLQFPAKDTLILLVPGYDYIQEGHLTGANLASPRKLIQSAGYDVEFIQIDPIGTIEENASVISDTILKNKDRTMVISGPSSAGPAIHLALGKLVPPDDLTNLKAWLNLGGILQGSPVLDQVSRGVKGLLFSTAVWYLDYRPESFESMRTEVSRKRFADLKVPQHIKIINHLGLSLSGDISAYAWDKYIMMRKDGPNDGLTLLPDIIAPNSLSILAHGSDHYFAEDPEIDQKTLALLVTLLEEF